MKTIYPLTLLLILSLGSCDFDFWNNLGDAINLCEGKTIIVNSEVGDFNNLSVCGDDEDCSLRNAIHSVTNTVCTETDNVFTLQLSENNTYVLNDGKEVEDRNDDPIFAGLIFKQHSVGDGIKIIVEGNGATIQLAEGTSPNIPDHLIYVHENATVEFRNIQFRTGDVQYHDLDHHFGDDPAANHAGGAIHNNGNVELINCEFHDCHAVQGAAIYNTKTATLSHCLFQDNKGKTIEIGGIPQYSSGGAIYNWGSNSITSISNCQFANNSADFAGAIYNEEGGAINLFESLIFANVSQLAKGVVWNDGGFMDVRNTDFENSFPLEIQSSGTLQMNDCEIFRTSTTLNNTAIVAEDESSFRDVVVRDFYCIENTCGPIIDAKDDAVFIDCSFYRNTGTTLLQYQGERFKLHGSYVANNNCSFNIVADASLLDVQSNVIIDNGYTGLISTNTSDAEFTNNIITNNHAPAGPGAILIQGEFMFLKFFHNTIGNNEVVDEGNKFEIKLNGQVDGLRMQNNVFFVKLTGNKCLDVEDIPYEGDIINNYVNDTQQQLPNQESYPHTEEFLGLLYSIESGPGTFVLTPPASLATVVPILTEVPYDKEGTARQSPLCSPGAVERNF